MAAGTAFSCSGAQDASPPSGASPGASGVASDSGGTHDGTTSNAGAHFDASLSSDASHSSDASVDAAAFGPDALTGAVEAAVSDAAPFDTLCVAGDACPNPGSHCHDSAGDACSCQGPAGSSFVFCASQSTDASVSDGPISDAEGVFAADAGVSPCSGSAPWTSTGTPAYVLSVDASHPGAAWNRFYERGVASDHAHTVLSTAWGRNTQNALRKGHDQAGFGYVRFHGILDSDVGVYTETNGNATYDWSKLDAIYDAITSAGMRPLVEISFMPPPLSTGNQTIQWYNGAPANITPPKDWTKWAALMGAFVAHLEQRYGAAEVRQNWYFEIWNEASWMYSLGEAGYPQLYSNTVKALRQADPQLKVGGPAASAGSTPEQMNSLVNYTRTNNLPLDFISYHRYGNDNGAAIADANGMLAFHKTVMSTAAQLNYAGTVLNDEWGATYSADVARDSEVSASFIAKTVHLIGTDTTPPPWMFGYWAISDLYEEFNTGAALAYREGNYGLMLKGDPRYPQSFDVAKPAFNAFRLLHMMGDARLSVTGGTSSDGVNAVATIDSAGSAIQILVYNHVNGGAANPTGSSLVNLSVSGLPFVPTSVRHYMVDHTHSNSYSAWVGMGKPQQPSSAQWTQLNDAAALCYYETTTAGSNSWSVKFPQNVYGVSLVVLSR